MGALRDIQRQVDKIKAAVEVEIGQPLAPAAWRFARESGMTIKIGNSARRAILAETGDPQLPETIDGVRLERTDEFSGFEVEIVGFEVETAG